MKYNKMHKNLFFREMVCGLTVEDTAKLCFKTVRQVKLWDSGKNDIPPECKRLMRMVKGRDLHFKPDWQGFMMRGDYLVLPNGQFVTPQRLLTAISVLEIGSELEIKTTAKLIKYARMLSKII
ncbi:phage protein [Vibrio plantisponsor]|uniref:Phage protein n=1 Tax=Vibrio plantisponsor TaxID=664643 RepID=A0ABU4IKE0_9VIBR|nr:phage protein [Vibrio plantisponsor]MDW6019032.1 phage protein [Vibrio plantisponsor]NNM41048.1 phage protein [Vibrio plantisponsor]